MLAQRQAERSVSKSKQASRENSGIIGNKEGSSGGFGDFLNDIPSLGGMGSGFKDNSNSVGGDFGEFLGGIGDKGEGSGYKRSGSGFGPMEDENTDPLERAFDPNMAGEDSRGLSQGMMGDGGFLGDLRSQSRSNNTPTPK